jgi:hypothetical protein
VCRGTYRADGSLHPEMGASFRIDKTSKNLGAANVTGNFSIQLVSLIR